MAPQLMALQLNDSLVEMLVAPRTGAESFTLRVWGMPLETSG